MKIQLVNLISIGNIEKIRQRLIYLLHFFVSYFLECEEKIVLNPEINFQLGNDNRR